MLEARRARRYDCNEGVDCELDGRVVFGLLQDVSLGGARLRGLSLPPVGTLLRVAPALGQLQRQWIFCQVCWVRRGEVEEAGIRFLEPAGRVGASWVGGLIDVSEPFERRTSVRVPAEVQVEIRAIGKRPMPTLSLDLSLEGAQIRAPQNLRPRERVDLTLNLPSGRLEMLAVVVRPASTLCAHHSLSFTPSVRDQAALTSFLAENRPQGRVGGTIGQAFLRLMNG